MISLSKIFFLASPFLIFERSLSAMSYQLISPGHAEISLVKGELGSQDLLESSAEMASLFVSELKRNETRAIPPSHSGNEGMIFASIAPDEQILSDLESELKVWKWIDSGFKTFGMGAIAAGSYALSNALKDVQGFTPARIAGVVATLAAVATESASSLVAHQMAKLEAEIAETSQANNSRFLYLDSQLDSQGHNSNPLLEYSCTWKNTCVSTTICVTNGLHSRDCQITPACRAEIIQCK